MIDTSAAKHALERRLSVPREAVWRAWTDPDRFARWYGPNVETVIHGFDVVTGGSWLSEMKMGGKSFFQRADFEDVVPMERMTFLLSTTDSDWQIASMPMNPDWPRTLLTQLMLTDVGSGTNLTLTSEPHGASAKEIACFNDNVASMNAGWNTGFDLMEKIVSEG